MYWVKSSIYYVLNKYYALNGEQRLRYTVLGLVMLMLSTKTTLGHSIVLRTYMSHLKHV